VIALRIRSRTRTRLCASRCDAVADRCRGSLFLDRELNAAGLRVTGVPVFAAFAVDRFSS